MHIDQLLICTCRPFRYVQYFPGPFLSFGITYIYFIQQKRKGVDCAHMLRNDTDNKECLRNFYTMFAIFLGVQLAQIVSMWNISYKCTLPDVLMAFTLSVIIDKLTHNYRNNSCNVTSVKEYSVR